MGFIVEPSHAEDMLNKNPDLSAVLFRYLNGDDLNSELGQKPSRWVINFFDWPLGRIGQRMPFSGDEVISVIREANMQRPEEWFPHLKSTWFSSLRTSESEARLHKQWLQLGIVPADFTEPVAADFPEALSIVETEVRPDRQRENTSGPDKSGRKFQLRAPLAERFWHFAEKTPDLYATIRPMRRCLARSRVSQYHNFAWVQTNLVMSEATVVIASDRDAMFAAVQSMWHQVWTEKNASSMRTDTRYTPSDCFETFPLPELTERMDETGKALDDARRAAMDARQIGLTDVSKLMHNPTMRNADIVALRQAVITNDAAVSAAYGWDDLDLEHGFYDQGRGPRFTVSPAARKEILRLLLAENHRRYAEEQAAIEAEAATNGKPSKSKKPKSKSPTADGGLFGDGELTD
jgi:hypothetical protein